MSGDGEGSPARAFLITSRAWVNSHAGIYSKSNIQELTDRSRILGINRQISHSSRRVSLSYSAFSLFVVGASSQFPHCLVLCFFYLYSFLLHVFSYNITPPLIQSSYLSVSTHFYVLITTSSVFLSTCPNHISLASLIFLLTFAIPAPALISSFLIVSILFIPIIHLNILISVLSSEFHMLGLIGKFHMFGLTHTSHLLFNSNNESFYSGEPSP